jgi:hypothetical protein
MPVLGQGTSIRNNPIAAAGIAAAIGFLYARIRR